MDKVLHAERLQDRTKRVHRQQIDGLPDGAFVAFGEGAFAVRGGSLLPWSLEGYGAPKKRPRRIVVDMLTPPAILAVLAAGYQPHWHPSARRK
jgi:hypothetical protein